MNNLIPVELIEKRIFFFRDEKVMVDRDLAELYQVSTKVLNQAVKRNIERFPKDFMFRINNKEKLQLVTICDRFSTLKHSTSLPYVFTEQGVAMLSSVLRSKRAIQVNIEIMKTFVKLRNLLVNNKNLANKILKIEQKYDEQFKIVFEVLRDLVNPPTKAPGKMGF